MSAANRKPVNRFRPSLETLENRDMMSVTSVTLNAGVLRVDLDHTNDRVQISESSLQFATATLAAGPAAGSLISRDDTSILLRTVTVTDLTRPGASWTFNRGAVNKVEVHNHLSYGDVNIINTMGTSLPTVVDLRNSNGTNQVDTGAGNDTVFGSEGSDIIRTGNGNDAIAAGDGNDFISGGLGSDSMFGGAKNDTIVDAFSTTDTNLIYGDAGNDTLHSFCENDVVDGGTEFDTARVLTGTAIVRKVEKITITDVPLGNAVTDNRATARQAVNRFLRAYDLPIITHAIQLNDSTSGLTSSRMLSLVREVKPDATLSDAPRSMQNILLKGKPTIAKFGTAWVVFTGYNTATDLFTFVGKDGLSHTTTASHISRVYIY